MTSGVVPTKEPFQNSLTKEWFWEPATVTTVGALVADKVENDGSFFHVKQEKSWTSANKIKSQERCQPNVVEQYGADTFVSKCSWDHLMLIAWSEEGLEGSLNSGRVYRLLQQWNLAENNGALDRGLQKQKLLLTNRVYEIQHAIYPTYGLCRC